MPPSVPDASPVLGLPFLMPAQAQKHVTHNEALRLLDVLVQLTVADRTLDVAPGAPDPGARHIVGPGATGVWAGQDGRIAFHDGESWQYIDPLPGWRAHVLAEAVTLVFTPDGWQAPADSTQQLARLGVGTTPDATNRLAVAAPAVLLTHAGAGHQLKINKAAATDTASLLFQTGWSGRAEMGLAGTDDFALKVSADGSGFVTALSASRSTGQVSLPAGLSVTGPITGTAVQAAANDETAGRLMAVGAFGLGGSALTLSAADDLNAIRGNGLYAWSSPAPANAPATFCQMLHVEQSGSTSRSQVVLNSAAGAVNTWTRGFTGGAWQPWRRLYHGANILGAVSQTDGIPTGAVIEQGANANGRWVKLADGTMRCLRDTLGAASAGTADGTIFRSADIAWTFPAAFAEAPVVTGQADDIDCWISAAAPSTTSCTVRLRSSVSKASSIAVRLVAHGRWAAF